MVTASILRQLMADRESLRCYASGTLPTIEQIKRRLFLLEREQDHRLPDHFYKGGRDFFLAGIGSIQKLVTVGLHRLGDEHLKLEGKRVYVKEDRWSEWQELLGFCSPLVCISAYLWKGGAAFPRGTQHVGALEDFLREWIEPNTRYTSLPSPRHRGMDAMLRDRGLCDLHVHLTGSTETDAAWQNFLKNPMAVYFEIAKGSRNEKVLEQMEQEFAGAGPLQFYRLLRTAVRLRYGFVNLLFSGWYTPELEKPLRQLNIESMLRSGGLADDLINPRAEHPLQRVFSKWPESACEWPDVTLEALMYIMVLDRIEATGDPGLAACFHHYLLILGLFNRFLVQQSHQYGFDQFQKITLNEFRSLPEKSYCHRFFQLHGNDSSYLAVLEGRFAPKPSSLETFKLLNNIVQGWRRFRKSCREQGVRRPRLHLVCHFIKEADRLRVDSNPQFPERMIRHRILRLQNAHKAAALVLAKGQYPAFGKYLAGVDAASNELDAPPEVFAPLYRNLRRKGFTHFTYHAGEDFHHLIGGLRAMFETVEFLGLEPGDRIGHGTAAGIDPGLWVNRIGGGFAINRGEWLDDLVFVLHLAQLNPSAGLAARIEELRSKVEELAKEVYWRPFSAAAVIQGWLARRWCPFHLLYKYSEVTSLPVFYPEEWQDCQEVKRNNYAMELVELYHHSDCRKRYDEKIMVQADGFFTPQDLRTLQDILLSELHQRGIVLEVLPTSNVRISFYKNYKEHHIWRWLGVEQGSNLNVTHPPIVLGTDDTGIFSTNIFNEYCHIYDHLMRTNNLDEGEALEVLGRIIKNGDAFMFTVPMTKTSGGSSS